MLGKLRVPGCECKEMIVQEIVNAERESRERLGRLTRVRLNLTAVFHHFCMNMVVHLLVLLNISNGLLWREGIAVVAIRTTAATAACHFDLAIAVDVLIWLKNATRLMRVVSTVMLHVAIARHEV